MIKHISILSLLSIIFNIGCSSQSPEKAKFSEVERFLGYLTDNKPDEIYKMSFHVDSENSITDKESRENYVNLASELIKKNGLPPKEKWKYSYQPENIVQPYTFRIPLEFDLVNNKSCVELIIAFPPSQISDKIHSFEIDRNLECIKFSPPVLLPKDSLQKN